MFEDWADEQMDEDRVRVHDFLFEVRYYYSFIGDRNMYLLLVSQAGYRVAAVSEEANEDRAIDRYAFLARAVPSAFEQIGFNPFLLGVQESKGTLKYAYR